MKHGNRYTWGLNICAALLLSILCHTVLLADSQWPHLAAKKKINLLIVHSFEESLSNYPAFNKLVGENLKKRKIEIDTRVFYLDCDAYDHDREIERAYNFLDTLSFKPDMILIVDDQATYSVLLSGHPLLKTVPIVFSGVNFPNEGVLKEYTNVTGLQDKPDYEKNIRMIEDVMGVKRIRFFYDKTYNGKQVIARLAEQYKDKDTALYASLSHFVLHPDVIPNNRAATIQENFNGLLRGNDYGERPTKTELYFINMRNDLGSNLLWNILGSFKYSVFLLSKYDYTIAKVGRLATVPTFSASNKGFTYDWGVLGGYFTTIEDQVDQTCDYMARIIGGEPIASLPIKETPKKYIVDWAVLNRWKIHASDLPAYVEVANMPFYVKYKIEMIVFSSLLAISVLWVILYLFFLYRREARRKRQAQINLWEEKEFLSLALEGGGIFAWKYDSDSEEFAFDKEFLDSVQLTYRLVLLKDLVRMAHPDEQESARAVFTNVVNGGANRGNLRVRIDFNDKGYVWYEFRFLNVSSMLGSHSSMIGLVMNIQEYKNREEELTAARDMAAKAELKQSFLANMSHEIRTPLNAIVGFSNILVNTEDLPDEEKIEYIQIINKNCELLLKLINDILEISRIESGNMSFDLEFCDLNELVEEVYEMCRLQTPHDVEFKKSILPAPLCVETDILRVKQVVANFINNAFKFTSSGSVTVGIENDKIKKEVCIYVEDTGTGIPEEEQKMIFNRFYKVDEFAQGTGLGLSICQVIADKLNGRITLSSEVGKGSRFGIVLPYANQPDPGEEPIHQVYGMIEDVDCDGDNRPVVLVAEDSVSSYMVINSILKKYCTIVWAANGKDALAVVRKRKIDLVLMDIKMHEMDGITALTKIRKSFKSLPVIMQTAYAFEENQNLARQAGASGFITKPISPDVLLNEIRKFIQIGGITGDSA